MTTRSKKATHDVEHTVSELAEDAGERLAAVKDEVVEMVEDRIDALGKVIQAHPLLAVGIGVGVGYLLARLLRD